MPGLTPRRFVLNRQVDHSGISGVGLVAWGVQFPDGVCALHWATEFRSATVFGSFADLLAIHGHKGDTRLDWLDEPTGSPSQLADVGGMLEG
jgi:hypothetical protein